MLDLDSPMWAELSHAYGNAAVPGTAPRSWNVRSGFGDFEGVPDTPSLLRLLAQKESDYAYDPTEPLWAELWSTLCHQGDAYTASYAAVPHIIQIAFGLDDLPNWQFFGLPCAIEVARATWRGPEVPPRLADAYFGSLRRLHELAYKFADRDWDEILTRTIAAALVAAKGHAMLADTIGEMSPELIHELRVQAGLDGD